MQSINVVHYIHSPEISIGPPFNLNCSIIHIIIDLDFFTVYKVALQVTITNLIFLSHPFSAIHASTRRGMLFTKPI